MYWVNQWDYSNSPTKYTTMEAVYRELTDTSSSGELEELRERVDKITHAFAKAVAAQPEHVQKEIVEAISYGWKPAGETK